MQQLDLLAPANESMSQPDAQATGWQSITDGQLLWLPKFFSPSQADRLYRELDSSLGWQQLPIQMFGRQVLQPRLQAWCGDAVYQYSGLTMQPDPWTPALVDIKSKLQSTLGQDFNSVLANKYRDGRDYMGWHQDNEPELGHQPVIASVSLGEERRFVIKHLATGEKREYALSHGSLLVMAGALQTHWLHSVPKTQRPKKSRINLTFRTII